MKQSKATIGKNSKARGKAEERIAAKILSAFNVMFTGMKRNPDNGTKLADLENKVAVVEVKSRQKPTPPLITGAWAQVMAAHEETGKTPYVVLSYKEANGKRVRWLVQKL